MIYILLIWTVVGASDSKGGQMKAYYDWRSIGEFHLEEGRMNKKTALEMCEDAARELALKKDRYRCVRSK
jgi:coenzyme F420-reducing hydrogenase delta subunit